MRKNNIDNLKKLKIKPLKEQWVMWVITALLAFMLVFIIGLIISVAVSQKIPWKYVGIVFAVYFVIIIIIAIISRVFYRGKLIITENEIIKLHGKKVQFKIKRDNLIFIGIRRTSFLVKLLVIISSWIGDMCTDIVSFRFYDAEIFEPRKFGGVLSMSSLSEEEKRTGMKEYIECLSYKDVRKISLMLNIQIQKIVF